MQGQLEMEYFCLKWKDRQYNMINTIGEFLHNGDLSDVTVACDGPSIKAHKIILSAASSFFKNIFLENPCTHPIIILPELKYIDLKALIDFIYHGQVNVTKNQLPAILKAAESLKIKGFGDCNDISMNDCEMSETQAEAPNRAEDNFLCENSNNSSYTSDCKYQITPLSSSADGSIKKTTAVQTELKSTHHNIDSDKESCESEHNMKEMDSDSLSEIIPSKLMEQTLITGVFQGKSFLENDNVSLSSFATDEKNADYDSIRINLPDSSHHTEMLSPNFHLNQDFRCFIKDAKKGNDEQKKTSNEIDSNMCEDIEGSCSETLGSPWDAQKMASPGPKRGRKPGSRLCVLCKHVFSSESDFKSHMDCHKNEVYPFINDGTEQQDLTDSTDLQMISERNLLKLPVQCATCKYTMTALSDAQSHLSTSPQCRTSQFKCLLCPKMFIWPATLMKHFREQHEGPGGSTRVTRRLWFFCDVCKKPLLSKHALSLHRSKFHGLSSHSNEQGPIENAVNCKRGRKQGTRVCRFCKRTFVGSDDYHTHLQNCNSKVDSRNSSMDISLNMSESTSSAENESSSSQSTPLKI